MSQIHPTAVVSPRAKVGNDVSIGPYCVVEDEAVLGDECRLATRVTIKTRTTLGVGNCVEDGAVLGGSPQHLAAGDRCGSLVIGDHNSIRENATIHRALDNDAQTVVGSHNLIMVNAHVGHDSIVEDYTIMANNVMLAGHSFVGHHAYLAGATGVHQFCRIGHYAMVGGQSAIKHDVPPFVTVDGNTNCVVGLNAIGLRRNGFTTNDISQLKAAYRVIYRRGHTWKEVQEVLSKQFTTGPASDFGVFFADGTRGYTQERSAPRNAFVPVPNMAADDDAELKIRRAS